ncbi:MAG: zinc ribbon domain-containing protein [Oscillospiraceae bacterium]|nr:zinc ribbon domain-containing protein [Oscillospiraceae bacterium]
MTLQFKPLTLFKLIALVLVVLCFVMMFLPWITTSVSGMGQNESTSFDLFEINKNAFNGESCFWIVLLKIFMILFFLAILAAVFGILTDQSAFVLPVSVLAVLMFLCDMFTAFWAKGKVDDLMGGYSSYLKDFGIQYGVHVGIGCWLFLLFGLAAFGVLFFESVAADSSPREPSFRSAGAARPRRSRGGWTCPNCGTALRDDQNFCTSCGTRKPQPLVCPNCGKTASGGSAFCSDCGSPLQ